MVLKQKTCMTMYSRINKLVMREQIIKILNDLRPELDFSQDIDFFEEGMLDSFDVVNLVNELESTFFVSIDGMDILPENFSSVNGIIALLNKNGLKK